MASREDFVPVKRLCRALKHSQLDVCAWVSRSPQELSTGLCNTSFPLRGEQVDGLAHLTSGKLISSCLKWWNSIGLDHIPFFKINPKVCLYPHLSHLRSPLIHQGIFDLWQVASWCVWKDRSLCRTVCPLDMEDTIQPLQRKGLGTPAWACGGRSKSWLYLFEARSLPEHET